MAATNPKVVLINRLRTSPDRGESSDGKLLQQYRRTGDPEAFAELVRRHGDLVLRVCRRVLQDAHAAEDAFQATYLLLARKAGSVRKGDSLPSFLHGMAYRVAKNAARAEARRRQREKAVARTSVPSKPSALAWGEVQAILDAEIQRLPPIYRGPFLYCCLEGQSRADAARQLGIQEVTLAGRLHRAKSILRDRLARRGIALGSVLAAVSLVDAAAAPPLLNLAVRAALEFAKADAAGTVSPAVLALARSGTTSVLPKATAVALLLFTGLLLFTATAKDSPATAATTLSSQPSAQPTYVEGVVQDERQAPLEGVPVWLLVAGYDQETIDGKALAQTRTDTRGHFRMDVPPNWRPTGYYGDLSHLGLLAAKPGLCPGALAIHQDSRGPVTEVKLTLRTPSEAKLTIWNSQQQPVPDAEVTVRSLLTDLLVSLPPDAAPELVGKYAGLRSHQAIAHGRLQGQFHVPLPPELRGNYRGKTDARGTVTLTNLTASQISQWMIRPESEPMVYIGKSPYKLDVPWPEGVVLPAPGLLHGKIQSPTAGLASGLTLKCYSSEMKTQILVRHGHKLMPADGSQTVFMQATNVATTDEQGRFTARLRTGYAGFHTADKVPEGYQLVPASSRTPSTITADKPAEIALELKPTVLVTGVVKDRDGRPLAGVRLLPSGHYRPEASRLVTDEQGQFSFVCLPGELRFNRISAESIPPLTARDLYAYRSEVPTNVKSFALPPLVVPTFTTLRGEVRDEAGQPAAGVMVTSRWLGQAGADQLRLQFQTQTTGADGRFTLDRVDPRKSYTLKAITKGRATESPVVVQGEALLAPVTLIVRNSAVVTGTGIVKNAAGQPVVAASVELSWRPPVSANNYVPPPPLSAAGPGNAIPPEDLVPSVAELPVLSVPLPSKVATDASGHFVLPALLGTDGQYRVVVVANGYVAGQSPWLTVKPGQTLAVPPIKLTEDRPFTGKVIDRRGTPIAGARVILHDATGKYRTTADPGGAFRFDHPATAGGFLFVDAPGYRFQGLHLGDSQSVSVTATRLNEKPEGKMTSLPPALPLAERRKLTEELFLPHLQKQLAGHDENSLFQPLQILAALDPALALETLEKKPFKTDWFYDSVKQSIALRLAREHLEEARTVAESIQKPSSRCHAYLEMTKLVPDGQTATKRDLLAHALLHARAEPEAARRVIYEGRIANQLIALGETEQGTRLLRAAYEFAKNLPASGWGAYARGAFAEELSTIDLPAAEKLCEGIEDKHEFTRHLGNMAHLLSGRQPEEAERILQKATHDHSEDFEYGRYAERVCYRMATVDLPRAKKIASQIKTYYHAQATAYARMAQALVKMDPAEAETLLRQAFAVLAEHASDTESDFTNIVDSPTIAASFLPVAESIDPALVPEFLWRALALRPDRHKASLKPYARSKPIRGDITLAMVISRYDRRVAEQLLEDAAGTTVQGSDGGGNELFAAAAVACPHRIREWLGQLGRADLKDYYLEAAVPMLLGKDERLWKQIHRKLFLWYPDEVDF